MSSSFVAQAAEERHEYTKLAMGTEARLVLYAESEEAGSAAARAAFARIVELDERLSNWSTTSEVSTLVLGPEPCEVSADLATVLRAALSVAARTDGAFDPTLGAWLDAGRPRLLSGDEVPRLGDWRGLSLEERSQEERSQEGPSLEGARLMSERSLEAPLDLGGIAKGFAADEALEVLRELGVECALVEIGGDLALGAAPPDTDGWRISLPSGETLVLERCGLATSGDTERFLELDGVRFSHVLDSESGAGVTHGLVTTVIAPTGMLADALATTGSATGDAAFVRARFPQARVLQSKPGFTELFDGTTLTGWTVEGGRYDGQAVWDVEDGAIIGRTGPNGEGGLLYTTQKYASFEFECEVKMDWPFDSGIFARMVPPDGGLGLQVTLDARPGGEVGAVYADGFLAHNEQGIEAWKRDDWNQVRVRVQGFEAKVEAWVNGVQVTDYSMPPELSGFAPSGMIGIQVHPASEGKVEAARFRNLRCKPLPMFDDRGLEREGELLGPGADAGWQKLLDGKTLEGWETVGSNSDYRVEDGALVVPAEGSGWIRTKDEYQDFRLRLDFKISEMANSGLALRATRDDANPAYSGCEIQILDDFNWEEGTQSRLLPYQFTGGLYGAVPNLDRKALRPIGEWNTYEVLARGERLACALNGRVLWDLLTSELEVEPAFADRAAKGAIGFQRYGAPFVKSANAAWFRNVLLEDLSR